MTRAAGFTLVELLVAIGLGWLVVGGALALHQTVGRASVQAGALAELNDAARFALAYIETDLRQAGYLGLSSDPAAIDGAAGPETPIVIPVRGDCGRNWTIDLSKPVAAFNDRYGLACAPRGGWRAGSDVLVVRRAAGRTAAPEAGRLQLHTSLAGGSLSTDGLLPAGMAAPTETRDLVVSAYYVSRASSAGADAPGLRRKVLRAGPRIVDEELMPGVTDLQMEFGIDLDAPGTAGYGSVDRWVHPEDPEIAAPASRIVAARVSLRVTANDAPSAMRASPRRSVLVSRSYALRNATGRER